MVHQHFMLVEVFTVAENLVLGREQGTAGLARHAARPGVRSASCRRRYRLDVDPDALVEDLPVGVQQRVEILKALANDAKYLIFDEPTAVLTPQEIDELIAVMRSLRDEGKAIVFITHKLREVRAIADTITVIRRGKVVGQAKPTDSEAQLAELMVGRAVSLLVERSPRRRTPRSASSWRAWRWPHPTARWWSTTSTSTSPAGRSSASPGSRATGRPSWPRPCWASPRPSAGRVLLDGKPLTGTSPREIIDAGLGFVPEDRKHDGFVGTFTVAENLVLNHFDEPPYAKGIALDLAKINAQRRAPGGRVRHPHPVDRRRPSPRCPAATSRRWCWPGSCPGRCRR